VEDVGHKVVAGSDAGKTEYPFDFHLLADTQTVNAFALPGGQVFITRALFNLLESDGELAGVLGHEIAHITQHHYRDAMAKDAAFSLLLQALFGNNSSQLTQLVAGSFHSLAALRVTQSNEAEADEYGTRHAGRIKRNPLGIAKFFSRFSSEGALSWISTHPDPPDRVESVTEEVNASPTLKALAADSLVTNYQARFETSTAALPR
jgi:predicted Zn-dependent protease